MFWQDIPIPSGLGHILAMLFDAVGRGLSSVGAGLRTPHNLNARATLRVLRRLEKILRLTYVMAATHMTNVPAREQPSLPIPGEGVSAAGDDGWGNTISKEPHPSASPTPSPNMGREGCSVSGQSDYGRSAYEHAARLLVETGVWQPPPQPFPNAKFKLWRTVRATTDATEKRPQPAHLIGAKPDLIRLVQRKLAELRDGMDHGMRYIISYAQDFAADVIYLPVHPPETSPPTWEREFWEEYRIASREARFQISEYWRKRREQRRRDDSS